MGAPLPNSKRRLSIYVFALKRPNLKQPSQPPFCTLPSDVPKGHPTIAHAIYPWVSARHRRASPEGTTELQFKSFNHGLLGFHGTNAASRITKTVLPNLKSLKLRLPP